MDLNMNYNYNAYLNQFIIPCPKNAFGIHPYCDCIDDYYDEAEKLCKSNMERPCPELSVGLGTDCRCIKKEYIFVESLWGCFSGPVIDGSPAIGICPNLNQQYPMCDISIAPSILVA